jgi:hypothetical protein
MSMTFLDNRQPADIFRRSCLTQPFEVTALAFLDLASPEVFLGGKEPCDGRLQEQEKAISALGRAVHLPHPLACPVGVSKRTEFRGTQTSRTVDGEVG